MRKVSDPIGHTAHARGRTAASALSGRMHRDAACACTRENPAFIGGPSGSPDVYPVCRICPRLSRTRTRPAHEHGMLMACLMSYRAPVCPPALLSRAFLALISPSKFYRFGSCCADDWSTLSFHSWQRVPALRQQPAHEPLLDRSGRACIARLLRFMLLASVVHVGILGLCLRPLRDQLC